jgi:predicted transcriptional regulator
MTDARILPSQVRAARAFLGWSIPELTAASGVSVRTIKYFESEQKEPSIKDVTVAKLTEALLAAGIEFIGTPEDGPGIRLRPRP